MSEYLSLSTDLSLTLSVASAIQCSFSSRPSQEQNFEQHQCCYRTKLIVFLSHVRHFATMLCSYIFNSGNGLSMRLECNQKYICRRILLIFKYISKNCCTVASLVTPRHFQSRLMKLVTRSRIIMNNNYVCDTLALLNDFCDAS